MAQGRAKNHHYAPQFYLKRWADPRGAVPVLLRNGQSFATGTRRIGQADDFYAVTRADGTKDSWVETEYLAPLDGVGSKLLDRLVSGSFPFAPLDRLQFARFLALQWMRGKRNRELVEAVHASVDEVLAGFGVEAPQRPVSPWVPP